MVLKASLHGPNRAANRNRNTVQNTSTSVSNETPKTTTTTSTSADATTTTSTTPQGTAIKVRVKALEKSIYYEDAINHRKRYGDACLLTKGNGNASLDLKAIHENLISSFAKGINDENDDPILIHFHDIPVFILRLLIVDENTSTTATTKTCKEQDGDEGDKESEEEVCVVGSNEDIIYLSEVQRYNHKICEDTIMNITCCSHPNESECYDSLDMVGLQVHLKQMSSHDDDDDDEEDDDDQAQKVLGVQLAFTSDEISQQLMNHTFKSVLSINELILISIRSTELVCRVYGVKVNQSSSLTSLPTAADAGMEEPYRGQVHVHTKFCISLSQDDDDDDNSEQQPIVLKGATRLPQGTLPEDIIHVTTSDGEWFPVKRILLTPCIKLTKYVQAGRGKYSSQPVSSLTLPSSERSEDAPQNDDGSMHIKISIDCCTFDRVLLFILSMLFPTEKQFVLNISEINTLSEAASVLGLQPLSDVCHDQTSSFDKRVRKDSYIRFAEVKQRNDTNHELLIILDGMVLDITQWLEEHPGGPSIIPSQALNMDCTAFFEMYHVSRQSFLYLKMFYIGELSPEDYIELKKNGNDSSKNGEASDAFLRSLRSFTKEWRIVIDDDKINRKVHQSL